jgi:chemotaxis methyl-accepting protein methylase
VIGTDLSAIQPTPTRPNVEFMRDDAEKEWLYSSKFDYIHLRLTFTCFDDHRKVMRSVFDNLNPGGWVEYQESETVPIFMDRPAEGEKA